MILSTKVHYWEDQSRRCKGWIYLDQRYSFSSWKMVLKAKVLYCNIIMTTQLGLDNMARCGGTVLLYVRSREDLFPLSIQLTITSVILSLQRIYSISCLHPSDSSCFLQPSLGPTYYRYLKHQNFHMINQLALAPHIMQLSCS